MIYVMSWRRSLISYSMRKSNTLDNLMRRLMSVRRELDWQNHRELGTNTTLSRLLEALRPEPGFSVDLERYGAKNDGGYVIHSHLARNSHLLSLGVGDNVTFDKDLVGIVKTVTLCDFSIAELPVEIPNARFIRKKVVPRVIDSSSEVTLSGLLDELPEIEAVTLKMDIEGYEWEILTDFNWAGYPQIHQLIVEFHGILQQAKEFQATKMLECLMSLKSYFVVVNFHPNNYGDFECFLNVPIPDVIELTLIRRSLVTINSNSSKGLLENHNAPNNPVAPEIYFPFPIKY